VINDRSGHILPESPVNFPYQSLALLGISFARLLIEHLLKLSVAITRIIALGPAAIVLVKTLVGSSTAFAVRLRPTT
jgi:hypothetical protein